MADRSGVARGLGLRKAGERLIVSEERRQDVMFTSKGEIELGLQESSPVMGKTRPKRVFH